MNLTTINLSGAPTGGETVKLGIKVDGIKTHFSPGAPVIVTTKKGETLVQLRDAIAAGINGLGAGFIAGSLGDEPCVEVRHVNDWPVAIDASSDDPSVSVAVA